MTRVAWRSEVEPDRIKVSRNVNGTVSENGWENRRKLSEESEYFWPHCVLRRERRINGTVPFRCVIARDPAQRTGTRSGLRIRRVSIPDVHQRVANGWGWAPLSSLDGVKLFPRNLKHRYWRIRGELRRIKLCGRNQVWFHYKTPTHAECFLLAWKAVAPRSWWLVPAIAGLVRVFSRDCAVPTLGFFLAPVRTRERQWRCSFWWLVVAPTRPVRVNDSRTPSEKRQGITSFEGRLLQVESTARRLHFPIWSLQAPSLTKNSLRYVEETAPQGRSVTTNLPAFYCTR